MGKTLYGTATALAAKRLLTRVQSRRALVDGFLAATGLSPPLTPARTLTHESQ
jgi:hypothetical protein